MKADPMRFVRRPVRTYMVRLRCAKCDEGEMSATGYSQSTYPARYGHRCNKCGAEEFISGATYPHIEHEEEPGVGIVAIARRHEHTRAMRMEPRRRPLGMGWR